VSSNSCHSRYDVDIENMIFGMLPFHNVNSHRAMIVPSACPQRHAGERESLASKGHIADAPMSLRFDQCTCIPLHREVERNLLSLFRRCCEHVPGDEGQIVTFADELGVGASDDGCRGRVNGRGAGSGRDGDNDSGNKGHTGGKWRGSVHS
jgi:hypothetical protein